MLRAIFATFVLMTGVLSPRLALPGDTADTAAAGGDTASGGDSASDSGADTADTDTDDLAADSGVDTADTAADPGFGAVDLSGEPGGCGCASSSAARGASPVWVALSALAALAHRRRRA